MEEWWVYQLHNAQAALEAVLAIDRAYTPDEVTGLVSVLAKAPTSAITSTSRSAARTRPRAESTASMRS